MRRFEPLRAAISPMSATAGTPGGFVESCQTAFGLQGQMAQTIDELVLGGVDTAVAKNLRELVAAGNGEAQVIAAFLYALIESVVGRHLGRQFTRAVMKRWKEVAPDKALDTAMRTALAGVTETDWNWIPIDLDTGVLPVKSGPETLPV